MKPETVHIIMIGYGCNLETRKMGREAAKTVLGVTEHPHIFTFLDNYKSDLSLTQAWNLCVGFSPCDFFVLINNDAFPEPQWLSKLMAVMLANEKCAFCGPSTNSCHSIQKTIDTPEKAKLHEGEIEVVDMPLSGFCLLGRKKVWEEVGGFDERFDLYGQESDLVDKAHKLNYQSIWVKSAFVKHLGEVSIKAAGIDVEKERARAKKLYWGERGK